MSEIAPLTPELREMQRRTRNEYSGLVAAVTVLLDSQFWVLDKNDAGTPEHCAACDVALWYPMKQEHKPGCPVARLESELERVLALTQPPDES